MTEIKRKKWTFKGVQAKNEAYDSLSLDIDCSKTLARLLVNRGLDTKEKAIAFIEKSQEILYNPFLLNDMDVAVKRILLAIEKKDKITIYGDYDVDGVTSVSILYLYLESLGVDIDYYIPCRKGEGYGISELALQKIKENGTSLIITVDTGVTAINEIEIANNLGLDVIVTDHHECLEFLPNAIAVINPKRPDTTYPFSQLAGVGVVFKLLCALEARYSNTSVLRATSKIASKYADLTAIGTIADVMPVIDENRIIVAYGLEKAENTENLGLASLVNMCRNGEGKNTKSKSKKRLTSGFVGYTIAPRINAAGRISSASKAVELFLSKNAPHAESLAYELGEINKERQFNENKIVEEANEIIEENGLNQNSMIILDSNEWHHGIIGIVSSRISDRFGIPSILISFEGNEDPYDGEAIGKGSGRSVPGMNLVDALGSCADLLDKFGGHELAAGLTIKRKNLEAFKKKLEEYAKNCFKDADMERKLEIDMELSSNEITLSLAKEMGLLEPYGISNPAPIFATKNMVIEDIIPLGMNKHLKLILSKGSMRFSAMLFSVSPEEFWLSIQDEVDVAYNLEVNEFAGVQNLQISIKDIRLSERSLIIDTQNLQHYTDAKAGNSQLSYDYIVPSREDFATVYPHLDLSSRCLYTVAKSSLLGTI